MLVKQSDLHVHLSPASTIKNNTISVLQFDNQTFLNAVFTFIVTVHPLPEGLVNDGVEGADQTPTAPDLGLLSVQVPQTRHLLFIQQRHAPLGVVVVGLELYKSRKFDSLNVHGVPLQGAVGGHVVSHGPPGFHQQVGIQILSHPAGVDVWENGSNDIVNWCIVMWLS